MLYEFSVKKYKINTLFSNPKSGYDDVKILKMLVKNGAIIDVDAIPNMLANIFGHSMLFKVKLLIRTKVN